MSKIGKVTYAELGSSTDAKSGKITYILSVINPFNTTALIHESEREGAAAPGCCV